MNPRVVEDATALAFGGGVTFVIRRCAGSSDPALLVVEDDCSAYGLGAVDLHPAVGARRDEVDDCPVLTMKDFEIF
jgi:hypothetical protein